MRVLLFAWRARRATHKGYDIVHSHMNGWCGDVEVVHVTPVRYNWRVRALPGITRLLYYHILRVQAYLRLETRRVSAMPGHRTVAVSGVNVDTLKQTYGQPHYFTTLPTGLSPS